MVETNQNILVINKPAGWTSFEVVKFIRQKTGIKKVGHAGTLDPLASGVLIIGLGEGTKKLSQFMGAEKEYEGEFILGVETDTWDAEGKIISKKAVNIFREEVEEVAKQFIGEIEQIPPMYSAVKVKGQKLYKLARRGLEIERKPRKVAIREFSITQIHSPRISFKVICSKGTYIRSLVHETGKKLGCGAHLSKLIRTRIGNISLETAKQISSVCD